MDLASELLVSSSARSTDTGTDLEGRVPRQNCSTMLTLAALRVVNAICCFPKKAAYSARDRIVFVLTAGKVEAHKTVVNQQKKNMLMVMTACLSANDDFFAPAAELPQESTD